jgi:hypothetical protein
MRLILESHSSIACLDEDRGYFLLSHFGDKTTTDTLKSLKRGMVGFKIPRFTEQLKEIYIRDPDYGVFPNFYKDEPIVFLIRDVRDVITSMARLRYMDNETWLRKYGFQILNFKMREPVFLERYAKEIHIVKQSGYADEAVGALYWLYKTRALIDYLDAGYPVCGVMYEDLVSNPRMVLRALMRFLSVPWEEDLLNHPAKPHGEVDQNNMAIGGTQVKQAIHDRSIGRYFDHFAPKQLDRIAEIVGELPDRLRKRIQA